MWRVAGPFCRRFHLTPETKLPMVTVVTNVDVPRDFSVQLSHLIAESTAKPVGRVTVHIQPNSRLFHGGVADPAVLISVRSIGKVAGEDNIRHSEKVTHLCFEALQVFKDKVVIEYFNLTPETVATNGTTVAIQKEE